MRFALHVLKILFVMDKTSLVVQMIMNSLTEVALLLAYRVKYERAQNVFVLRTIHL